MITEPMTLELINIYSEHTKKKVKRKKVKIIVDSLIEQICEHFLGHQPNGKVNIRLEINFKLNELMNNEKDVLNKFQSILRTYDEAFSKTYSDYTDNFNSFLNVEFKALILVLIKYDYFQNHVLKSKLKELLA